MLKCEKCIHKKICIDGANYKNAEACRNFVNENDVAPVKHGHWKKGKGCERPTENGFVHDDRYFCDCCEWQYKDEAENLLKSETLAEFQPVIHARWEISSDGYYPYCKKCNARPENGKMTKYCPYCSAKLCRGE